MEKDVTLTNKCSVVMNNECHKMANDKLSIYNKIWSTQYTLNDIKRIEFGTKYFIVRFSGYHGITIDYDGF